MSLNALGSDHLAVITFWLLVHHNHEVCCSCEVKQHFLLVERIPRYVSKQGLCQRYSNRFLFHALQIRLFWCMTSSLFHHGSGWKHLSFVTLKCMREALAFKKGGWKHLVMMF